LKTLVKAEEMVGLRGYHNEVEKGEVEDEDEEG